MGVEVGAVLGGEGRAYAKAQWWESGAHWSPAYRHSTWFSSRTMSLSHAK